jgi:protein TonB
VLAVAIAALIVLLFLLVTALLALWRAGALASAPTLAFGSGAARPHGASRLAAPRKARPGAPSPRPKPTAVVQIEERPRKPPRPAVPVTRPPREPHPVPPRTERQHAGRAATPATAREAGAMSPVQTLPVKPAPRVPLLPGVPWPSPNATPADQGSRQNDASYTAPVPVEQPDPHYPEDAAAEGVTGTVRLKVVVGPRGLVESALVVRSSGDGRLDRAAEAAVRQWRYRPGLRGGRPRTAVDYVEVEFFREDEPE